jgi:hypothetical protein
MKKLLDAVVIVGLLVNIVKASDLILRPHQQKQLQQSFESLVLWLEDCKPIIAVEQLLTPRAQDALLTGSYIFVVIWASISWIGFALMSFIVPSGPDGFGFDPLISCLFVLINLPMLLLLLPRMRTLGRTLVKWLLSKGRFHLLLIKFLILNFSVYLWFILVLALIYLILRFFNPGIHINDVIQQIGVQDSLAQILYFVFGTITMPFLSLTLILYVIGLMVVFLTIAKWINEMFLKFIRALVWRIVEYNKGAFAALALIITVALGILDLYIKSQK